MNKVMKKFDTVNSGQVKGFFGKMELTDINDIFLKRKVLQMSQYNNAQYWEEVPCIK